MAQEEILSRPIIIREIKLKIPKSTQFQKVLLWIEFLYPPKISMLKPNPLCDDIWRWEPLEVD